MAVQQGGRRLVLVGNGMAGARLLEEVLERQQGLSSAEQLQITVFGEEPYGNYNRIMLSHVLAGEDGEESIYLNELGWYAEHGIDLRSGVRVTDVDTPARTVTGADGSVTPYDVLVIATGSSPHFPPMDGLRREDGSLLPGVSGFRSLDETRAMLEEARSGQHARAVVIGGGLLGLEAAKGLHNHGLDVTVVHSPAHLMNQQLDAAAGAVLRRSIEDCGIAVVTGARTTGLTACTERGRVSGVVLKDGRTIEADMVVVTAGIRPSTDVALRAGLTVERGIVVDDQMRCVEEDAVYALGECAQHRGETYGLVAPLWEQAVVLADVLTGADPDAAYHGSRTSTKLKVAGVDVSAIGQSGPEHPEDEHVVFSDVHRGLYQAVVLREGRLVGATLLGDVRRTAALQQAFDRGLPLPEQRAELLFDLGDGGAEVGVEELGDDVQVCNCNGVTKGDICGAVADGCSSVKSVMDATRAGKGCGSCKELVGKVVEHAVAAGGGALTEDPSVHWYVPGVPLRKDELVAAVREQHLTSVSAVFAALAPGGTEDAKSKMGLTSLLRTLWPQEFVDERDARFINDRVHANIQRDGTFSVVPQMLGGVTTPDQLRRIADVADKYGVGMLKVTGGQRIDMLGVRKEDLPKVWEDLDMPSGYAYGKSMRTVKTCVGTDYCRFGLGDSTALGIAIERRFQGIETPAKLKLGVVGCPRNCAEAYVKDVGVVAVGAGRWEVYVGGAAGASVRKGDLLATVDSPEAVLQLTGRFIQFYRTWGNWLERTYDFVPRLSVERLRLVLVEDSDGMCAQLDEEIEAACAAYQDPWKERGAPDAPGRFSASALPLVPLPLVPRRPVGAPTGVAPDVVRASARTPDVEVVMPSEEALLAGARP